MIIELDKEILYNSFGVKEFSALEMSIDNMAPSLVEYHLAELSQYNDESYFNKRDIQTTINIGNYNIYLDYNKNIFLEISKSEEDTPSLW